MKCEIDHNYSEGLTVSFQLNDSEYNKGIYSPVLDKAGELLKKNENGIFLEVTHLSFENDYIQYSVRGGQKGLCLKEVRAEMKRCWQEARRICL